MNGNHIFLTGLPFVGKTTALLRVVQSLDHAVGFITQAIECGGKRTGLTVITSHQRVFNVASVGFFSSMRHGKYFVDISALDRAVQEIINDCKRSQYIYIDEVGTLFCQSPFFIDTMRSLFESHTLIGVISKKGHPFITEIHRRPDCCFTEVTANNRDDVPNLILNKIKTL